MMSIFRFLKRGALGVAALAAVLLTSQQALAVEPHWSRAGFVEGATVYVDTEQMLRSGKMVKLWTLIDLKTPQSTARGKPYRSQKALVMVDCDKAQMKVLQVAWYAERMGGGELAFDADKDLGDFMPVTPSSQSEYIWKFVCVNRR